MLVIPKNKLAVKDPLYKYIGISGMFTWAKTPQGHGYWEDINAKMSGL